MDRHCAAVFALLLALPARAGDDKGLQHQRALEEYRRFSSERRRALVIGASSYQHVRSLPGASHDIDLVSDALEEAGFEITLSKNDDKKDIERAIVDFASDTLPDDVVLVYWSGHGVQRDGKNWLIPVDAEISKPERLSSEAIDLDAMLKLLGEHRGRLNMVLLDACRNNPWESEWSASGKALGGEGLAQPAMTPSGFLIAYATDPGREAADGGNGAGPYAKALAANIASESELQEVFQRVHAQVELETEGGQRPWVTMALGPGRFFFTLPSAEEYARRYGDPDAVGTLWVRAGYSGALVVDGRERAVISRGGRQRLDLVQGVREVCLGEVCQKVEIVPGEQAELSFRPSREALDWNPILELSGGYTYGDVGLAWWLEDEEYDASAAPVALGQGGALQVGVGVEPIPGLRGGITAGAETASASVWFSDGSCYSEERDWGSFPCAQLGVQGLGALRLGGSVPWDRSWTPTLAVELQGRLHGGTRVQVAGLDPYRYKAGLEGALAVGLGMRVKAGEHLGWGLELQGARSITRADDAEVPEQVEPLGGIFRVLLKVEVKP